jgi:hypothetical protein
MSDIYNTDNYFKKEHLETEELINNFKFKYEELKDILDDKIKELHQTEFAFKDCIQKFQFKFDELENVNSKLRSLLIEKQAENEELNRQNIEFYKRLNGDTIENYKTIEKDRNIEELNYKLKNLELILKERDETIHNLKSTHINNTNETWNNITQMSNTNNYQKKYNLLKEKYAKLKHNLNEKEDYIRVK